MISWFQNVETFRMRRPRWRNSETRANHLHLPPVRSPPPANQHLGILQTRSLPFTQTTVPKHWK